MSGGKGMFTGKGYVIERDGLLWGEGLVMGRAGGTEGRTDSKGVNGEGEWTKWHTG